MTDKATEALAEQPAQQPAAWMYDTKFSGGEVIRDLTSIAHPSAIALPDEGFHNIRPLYTSPQPSKPLTDEFLRKLHHIYGFELFCDYDDFEHIARSIEAAHGIKEKNT